VSQKKSSLGGTALLEIIGGLPRLKTILIGGTVEQILFVFAQNPIRYQRRYSFKEEDIENKETSSQGKEGGNA